MRKLFYVPKVEIFIGKNASMLSYSVYFPPKHVLLFNKNQKSPISHHKAESQLDFSVHHSHILVRHG